MLIKFFDIYRDNKKVCCVRGFSGVLDFIFSDYKRTNGVYEYSFKESFSFEVPEHIDFDFFKLKKVDEGYKKEFFCRKGFINVKDAVSYIRGILRHSSLCVVGDGQEFYIHPSSPVLFKTIDELENYKKVMHEVVRSVMSCE